MTEIVQKQNLKKKNSYFGDVDEFDDNFGSLLRSAATEYHTLDPLRQPVEQVHRPLQTRVVTQRARHRVLLIILELFPTFKNNYLPIHQIRPKRIFSNSP